MTNLKSCIVLFFFIISPPGFCFPPFKVPPSVPTAGSTALTIHNQYVDVANKANPHSNVLDPFSEALSAFCQSLQTPPAGNNQELIHQLTHMYEDVESSIDFLMNGDIFATYLQNVQILLLDRLRKTKIDQAVTSNTARIDDFNLPGIPLAVQNVLPTLVGAIFHVILDENGNKTVRRVGSGIAIPSDAFINDVDFIDGLDLDHVLTCAHVLKASEKTKFLFILFPKEVFIVQDGLIRH